MLLPGGSQPPPPQRAVDLLVDLPTDVLDKILATCSRPRDVVRDVRALAAVAPPLGVDPGLDIELHDVRDEGGAWGSVAGFLKRCAAPVGRVSIRGIPLSFYHRANDWVLAVVGKNPRSLSLKLPPGHASAVALPLRPRRAGRAGAALLRDPGAAYRLHGFQWLTKLDLDDVFFTVPGGWVIQAPNLRRLVLCLPIAGAGLWELGPLPNLELARIFLNDSAEDRDFVQMFTAISNVRELHIGNFHINKQVILRAHLFCIHTCLSEART
ncbi:unnamed protein product [Miscanthus lutarioriparius]|uniref:F-box domain-containing protein n=1 Tax=Miscanthus lutarioriparius TaxID=422564 RepID=A0A811NPS8_9POAL|nr:unnamed protein product [Miscanthus lutarioriparius]